MVENINMVKKNKEELTRSEYRVTSRYFDGTPKVSWVAEELVLDDGRHLVFRNIPPFRCLDRGREKEFPFQVDQYFWRDKWFNIFAFINDDSFLSRWYCNVATPAQFCGRELIFTDLDLDLIVLPDGEYEVLDRDEFKENKEKYSYSPAIVAAAEDSLATLIKMVEGNEYPFNMFFTKER